MGLLRDDPLGGKSIDAVKPSNAKEWAIRMRVPEGNIVPLACRGLVRGYQLPGIDELRLAGAVRVFICVSPVFSLKEWAIRMREKGFSFQSISNYKRSLRAAFFIAICEARFPAE